MLDLQISKHQELERLLKRRFSAKKLTSKKKLEWEVEFIESKSAFYFETDIQHKDKKIFFILVPNKFFPIEKPDIYTYPKLELLNYPHVEGNSKLCVWDSQILFNSDDVNYVEQFILDAYEMVRKTLSGKLNDDFIAGFLSYWRNKYKNSYSVTSICDLNIAHSRDIYTLQPKNSNRFFSDSEEQLKEWCSNKNICVKNAALRKASLINIHKTWKPIDYPETVSDLVSNLVKEGMDILEVKALIINLLTGNDTDPSLLIRFQLPTGIVCVGFCIDTSKLRTSRSGRNHMNGAALNGFREGKIPMKIFDIKIAPLKLIAFDVKRKDVSWVLGRDRKTDIRTFQNTSIALVGLGSVGSSLLPLLIRIGFKEFTLVDEDILEPENIGRHWLNDNYVGVNKAVSCATEMKRTFPWVKINHVGETCWYKSDESLERILDSDLIISATGERSSDMAFHSLIRAEKVFSPIVFCFTEPFACATHCIVNPSNKLNYFDLFDEFGSFKETVCNYPEVTVKDLPECGGAFQPYGAMELSYGHTMIVEVICNLTNSEEIQGSHSVWVGSKNLVKSVSATWSESWQDKYGSVGNGSRIIHVE